MNVDSIPEKLALSSALLPPGATNPEMPAWPAAAADGGDLNLVERRWRWSVQERRRRHNPALNQAVAMRAAFRSQCMAPAS